MTRYTLLLLKKNDTGAKQIHFGSLLIFFIFFVVVVAGSGMGYLFYDQNKKLISQQQVILEQETMQAGLQRRIDMFDGREARIEFLEDYVEELKQNAYTSEITLKKNMALMETSITQISRLHDSLCGTLNVSCIIQGSDEMPLINEVDWLQNMQRDFDLMDKSLKDFALNRKSFEEQAATIEELQAQLKQMEQNLAEHVEYIEVNQSTIDRLNRKISKATGISLDRKSPKLKSSKSKKGRGGPSMMDYFTLENNEVLKRPGMLRKRLYQQTDSLDEGVSILEDLSLEIDKKYLNWRQTPTMIPIRSRLLSDRYGKRKDPFTKKWEFHGGVDFIARTGTKILAPADGIVRLAKRHYGFGKMVELQHSRGFYPGQRKTVRYRTRYAHLSKILVKRRQRVNRGDVIGLVGSTGRSTGPHLHYEILINNRRSDPMLTIKRFNSEKRLYIR
jgi:murein DD-endopeptidase MepM/ murein hydrolase activator NlpD